MSDSSDREVEAAVEITTARIVAALDGMSIEAVRALVSEFEAAEANPALDEEHS